MATGASHRLIQGQGPEALDPKQVAVDGTISAATFGLSAKLAPVMSLSPLVRHTGNTALGAAMGAGSQAASNLADGRPLGENVSVAVVQGAATGLVSGIAMSPSDPAFAQALEPETLHAMRAAGGAETTAAEVDQAIGSALPAPDEVAELKSMAAGPSAAAASTEHPLGSAERPAGSRAPAESPAAPSVRFRFVYDGKEWWQEAPAGPGLVAPPRPNGQLAAAAKDGAVEAAGKSATTATALADSDPPAASASRSSPRSHRLS